MEDKEKTSESLIAMEGDHRNGTQKEKAKSCWKTRTQMEKKLLIVIILLALALLLSYILIFKHTEPDVCMSDACVQVAAKFLGSIDRTVDPCEDFHEFVCGEFLDLMQYHPNATGDTTTTDYSAKRRYDHIIDTYHNSSAYKDSPSIGLKNIWYLYDTCMDDDQIENGVDYLKEKLIDEMGWPMYSRKWNDSSFNWTNAIIKLRHLGFKFEFFFETGIYENYTENKNYIEITVPSVNSALASIDDATNYFSELLLSVELFGGNIKYIKNDLTQLAKFMDELNELLVKYAPVEDALGYKKPNPKKLTSFEDLEKELGYIAPWREVLSNITNYNFSPKDKLCFNVTEYVKELHTLFQKTPKRVQLNYIIWEILKDYEVWYMFTNTSKVDMPDRRKACINEVNDIIGLVPIMELARSKTTTSRRKAAYDMILRIQKQLLRLVQTQTSSWISEPIRQFLMDKISKIRFFIGGQLMDGRKLITPYDKEKLYESKNFIDSICRAKLIDYAWLFDIILNQTADESTHLSLMIRDNTANAYYYPNNYISIPTASLYEIFDEGYPYYINYARLGYAIAHEFSHVLSLFAMEYGNHGEDNYIWNEEYNRKYLEHHKCLVEEYENYAQDKYEIFLNGTITFDENIADLIGMNAAYEAMQDLDPGLKLPVIGDAYTPNQLFWMYFGMYHCDPQEIVEVAAPDAGLEEHGISSYRVTSSLRNSKRFSEDFNCPKGSKMNPVKKCDL